MSSHRVTFVEDLKFSICCSDFERKQFEILQTDTKTWKNNRVWTTLEVKMKAPAAFELLGASGDLKNHFKAEMENLLNVTQDCELRMLGHPRHYL